MKLQFLLSILSACCLLSGLDSEEPSDFKVIGSNDTIKAAVGEDVILPCHLKPPRDVCTLTVEWKRNGTAVHTYRSRGHNVGVQDESFKDRTSLFCNEMFKGNISLKLLNVTEQDKGVYTCAVSQRNNTGGKTGNVTLEVVSKRKKEEMKGDPRNNSPPASLCDIHGSCIVIDIGIGIGIGIAIIIAIAIVIGIGIVIGIRIERRRRQRQDNPDSAAHSHELARLHSD